MVKIDLINTNRYLGTEYIVTTVYDNDQNVISSDIEGLQTTLADALDIVNGDHVVNVRIERRVSYLTYEFKRLEGD